MITPGRRAAILSIVAIHTLVPGSLPTARATAHVAQSRLIEILPILSLTAPPHRKAADPGGDPSGMNDASVLPGDQNERSRTPIGAPDGSGTGMRAFFSGMAVGGMVVLVVWMFIRRSRGIDARARRGHEKRGLSSCPPVDVSDNQRTAARAELLARLERAETYPGSAPPHDGRWIETVEHADSVDLAHAAGERAVLLREGPSPAPRKRNGTRSSQGIPDDPSFKQPAAVNNLLQDWDDAFRRGDLDACRRAMRALAGRIEAEASSHLHEETQRMSETLEASLRERFTRCVRCGDYRGALAVGSEIKRQLPTHSVAADFDRIHPYLLRRIRHPRA